MNITPKLSHDDLARSLAGHLRGPERMVWCDMQLGPSGSPRPDVYTLAKSYLRPTPLAYECKVSVADFRGDVTSGKWQSYLHFSSGVYFACEAGLISKDDVPPHCGLIVLSPAGNWRIAVKATLRPVTVPQDAFLKLVIDGVGREGPAYRRKAFSEDQQVHRLRKRFGEVVANTVRDRLAVEQEIEGGRYMAKRIEADARSAADRIRKDASEDAALMTPLRAELCAILGLSPTADRWTIQREVNKLKHAIAEHPAQSHLRELTNSLQRALQHHGFKESPETVTNV